MRAGKASLRFHCVSIVAGAHGCAAAQELRGVRLLSAEAPRLPLPVCTAPDQCRCIYRHHDQRRIEQRRADERAGLAGPRAAMERRHHGGRRATDVPD